MDIGMYFGKSTPTDGLTTSAQQTPGANSHSTQAASAPPVSPPAETAPNTTADVAAVIQSKDTFPTPPPVLAIQGPLFTPASMARHYAAMGVTVGAKPDEQAPSLDVRNR